MKSLELNWIRRYDKSLIIPEVVFSSLEWAGGMYFYPEKKEICIDGKYYSLECGLIEVSEDNNKNDKEIASTLAHEWRHHWQTFNFPMEEFSFYWPDQYDDKDYDKMIVKYFTSNKLEMDALKFQKKYSSIFDLWEELLYVYL